MKILWACLANSRVLCKRHHAELDNQSCAEQMNAAWQLASSVLEGAALGKALVYTIRALAEACVQAQHEEGSSTASSSGAAGFYQTSSHEEFEVNAEGARVVIQCAWQPPGPQHECLL